MSKTSHRCALLPLHGRSDGISEEDDLDVWEHVAASDRTGCGEEQTEAAEHERWETYAFEQEMLHWEGVTFWGLAEAATSLDDGPFDEEGYESGWDASDDLD